MVHTRLSFCLSARTSFGAVISNGDRRIGDDSSNCNQVPRSASVHRRLDQDTKADRDSMSARKNTCDNSDSDGPALTSSSQQL
jgi:hypothetical protein